MWCKIKHEIVHIFTRQQHFSIVGSARHFILLDIRFLFVRFEEIPSTSSSTVSFQKVSYHQGNSYF